MKFQDVVNQVRLSEKGKESIHQNQIIKKLFSIKPSAEINIHLQRTIFFIKQNHKNNEQISLIEDFLSKHFRYFTQLKDLLAPELFFQLFKEMTLEHVIAETTVFKYGEIGDVGILLPSARESIVPSSENKIVEEDKIEQIESNFPKFTLVQVKGFGDHFGEIALYERVPRVGTAYAVTNCVLGTLTFESYQKLIYKHQEFLLEDKVDFIKQIPLFKQFPMNQISILLHCLVLHKFKSQQCLYKYNEEDDGIYIIKEGEVKVTTIKNNKKKEFSLLLKPNQSKEQTKELQMFSKFSIFGYQEWIDNMSCASVIRKSTAFATTEISAYKITMVQFRENLQLMGNLNEFLEMVKNKNTYFQSIKVKTIQDKQIPKILHNESSNNLVTNVREFSQQFYNYKNEISPHPLKNIVKNEASSNSKNNINNTINNNINKSQVIQKPVELNFDKLSFLVPFREDPINKEQDLVSNRKMIKRELPSPVIENDSTTLNMLQMINKQKNNSSANLKKRESYKQKITSIDNSLGNNNQLFVTPYSKVKNLKIQSLCKIINETPTHSSRSLFQIKSQQSISMIPNQKNLVLASISKTPLRGLASNSRKSETPKFKFQNIQNKQ